MGSNVDAAMLVELLRILRERGADRIEHSETSLYEHLTGVFSILDRWGVAADVALAGLFHSAYGTESFGVALFDLSDRSQLAGVIGAPAERLVFLFSTVARGTLSGVLLGVMPDPLDARTGAAVPLDEQTLIDLMVLSLANTREMSQRDPMAGGITDLERQVAYGIRHRLPEAALRWIDEALA